MGKRDLKKQYTELEYNFVDLISLLDTTPTKKMTPFLVKQFNDWIQYTPNEMRKSSEEFETMRRTLGDPKNELDEIVKRMVFKWAQPKLEIIKEFTEHMESNRLEENDINNYDNWNAIKLAVNEAEIKQGIKNNKNKIMILHQDEEWLVLKPLSMEASVNYGYGTKWCTSMKNSNSYFHKYSRNGVLVFVINRKNGVKYAIYSSPKEFSVWTATDARIDSMETTIPFDLLMRMKEWTNFDEVGPNYNYFEDEDKENNGERKRGHLVALGALRSRIVPNEESSMDETYGDLPHPSEEAPNDEVMMESWGDEIPMEVSYTLNEAPPLDEFYEDESMDVSVDIENHGETMVGYEDSVHGSITEQNERTWENPYPSGPGGGFVNEFVNEEVMDEMPEEMMERVIPANRETAEAFEIGYDEGSDMESPQSEY